MLDRNPPDLAHARECELEGHDDLLQAFDPLEEPEHTEGSKQLFEG